MKKILFTIFLTITAGLIYGQTTYYWVGGTAITSYTSNSNWNTQLNGLGSSRTAAANDDVLIFDGTNVGGTTPTTGQVTTTASGTTSGRLVLRNAANIIIGRATAGSASISIAGDGGPADDLVVEPGCTLTLGMAIYNHDVNILVSAGASALIGGTVYLSPLSTTVHTRSYITAAAANGVIFTATAVCHITDSSATSGFNGSVQDGVRFLSGSSCYYYTGRSPIGSSSTLQYTNYDEGSNLYFMNTNRRYDGGATYTSSAWSNRKGLGNLFIKNGSTFFSDGPFDRIGDLTIDGGCTLITHSSGVSPVLGNLTVNGILNGPAGSSNTIVMGGHSPQTISGTGMIDLPNFTVANFSNVTLARTLNVLGGSDVFGRLDFGATNQLTGPGDFTAKVSSTAGAVTGDTEAGSYRLSNVGGILTGNTGLKVTGNGLAPNTNIVGFSGSNAVLLLSKPALSTVTGATYNFSSDTATMATANTNGMDSLTGSVVVIANKSYQAGTNYVINGATTKPFGISSGSTATTIDAGFVDINANVTVNRSVNLYKRLLVNGKLTLRPADLVHLFPGAAITGTFSNTKYIATDYTVAGVQSLIQVDGVTAATTVPVGTTVHYLPVTITPTTASDFTIAAFTGITTNGMITGTPMPPFQKQRMVDAVWNVNRLTGTGNATVQINWPTVLEGSTYTTLTNAEIGLIQNAGSSWNLPIGTANNTTNIATATISSFTPIGSGAVAQVNPFIFNAIAAKTYGNPDFNGGATSLNTTQPIVYTSSDPLVATIVGGLIHITGSGTSTINASQASDGNYPAASVNQTLTVNKAPLTVRADDKTKFEQVANPPLTITYTGFVLGETSAVLLTQPTISTTAVLASPPGTYPITVTGATAANYIATHVNGTMTVTPKQNQTITFNVIATKTYGNAAFAGGATSTNSTLPITYSSSNTAVATISGSTITITGAGTSTITAMQAGNDGYFPATPVSRTLTVNKANLTIRVLDTLKTTGQANPDFTITYTGFVYSQTSAALTTLPVATTTAIQNSSPGYYPITLSGATSPNYNIIYTNGRLTVLPLTGTSVKHINAYKNAAGNITVRVYSNEPVLGDILVYDMSGRPVIKKNFFMPQGFNSTNLLATHLPSGIYTVIIIGNNVDLRKMIAFIK